MIATCWACGQLYDTTTEDANAPNRRCVGCYKAEKAKEEIAELRTARQEGFNGGVERTRSVAKENIFCCPECTDSKCDKFYYFDEAIRKLKKKG